MSLDLADLELAVGYPQRNIPAASEISLEFLPNPEDAINELNKQKVEFKFEDESGDSPSNAKKRRAITSVGSSFVSEVPPLSELDSIVVQDPHYEERAILQSQLLERLEMMNGVHPHHFDYSDPLDDEMNSNTNISTTTTTLPPSTNNDQNVKEQAEEEEEPKLGIYNQQERMDRLNAYREKRKQRVFGKVRYVLRKRASEGRQRVKGRFAKEEASTSTTTPNTTTSTSNDTATPEIEIQQGIAESTSWLEGMSLGARRLSNTVRRSSTPLLGGEDGMEHRGSWSSWLLNTRRKSTSSTIPSRREGGNSLSLFETSSTSTNNIQQQQQRQQQQPFDSIEEPERKRPSSGSSLVSEVPLFQDEVNKE